MIYFQDLNLHKKVKRKVSVHNWLFLNNEKNCSENKNPCLRYMEHSSGNKLYIVEGIPKTSSGG